MRGFFGVSVPLSVKCWSEHGFIMLTIFRANGCVLILDNMSEVLESRIWVQATTSICRGETGPEYDVSSCVQAGSETCQRSTGEE